MSSEEVAQLQQQLLQYKVGHKIGDGSFHDAEQGEMENFRARIAVFGMTGSGKSALINTVHKLLYGREHELAVVQSAGGEGTQILEEFFTDQGFTMFDTRGFFEFNTSTEETEFFRILYGAVRTGDVIDRGAIGERQAASVGTAAHKLNRPPLSRQVHVVLWVIKANDVRLSHDLYRDKFRFVQGMLRQHSITIITVVTHSDVVDNIENLDERRAEVIKKAREATGSFAPHTFLLSNWLSEQPEYDLTMQTEVLRMMNTALECAERSIKMRQNLRRAGQRRSANRAKESRERRAKVPREDDEDF